MTATSASRAGRAAIALIIILLFVSYSAKVSSQVPVYKQTAAERLLDRIAQAVGEPGERPKVSVVPGRSPKAGHFPLDGTITISEGLYDLCMSLGRDSLDALAYVLSHEMAHFYRHHGVEGWEKKKPAKPVLPNLARHDSVTQETEADLYGGVYSRMAGFNALDIAPEVLERVYEDDAARDWRYLPRDERKGLVWNIEVQLAKLFVTYEAANHLTLIRRYDDAARCYDHVIEQFPSRELFNNAGMGYLLRALDSVSGDNAGYIYPVEFDADSRLRGLEVTGGTIDRSQRSPNPVDEERFKRLLDNARKRFDSAIARDKGYAAARINLATVELLEGHFNEAINMAQAAMAVDTSHRVRILATVVKIVAAARKGNHAEAQRLLDGLSSGEAGNRLIESTRAILSGSNLPSQLGTSLNTGRETVHGIAPDETGALWPAAVIDTIPTAMYVLSKSRWSTTVTRVQHGAAWAQFVAANPAYDGHTRKGIHVGSTRDDVTAAYGTAFRSLDARQGCYYIYTYSKIIFFFDNDGLVKTWILYATD